jgi:hypothetical protein
MNWWESWEVVAVRRFLRARYRPGKLFEREHVTDETIHTTHRHVLL